MYYELKKKGFKSSWYTNYYINKKLKLNNVITVKCRLEFYPNGPQQTRAMGAYSKFIL